MFAAFAVLPVLGLCAAGSSPSPSLISVLSYWIADGAYPSTPSRPFNFPLFAIRSLLSFSNSAMIRAFSFFCSNFSRFRADASRFLWSLSISSFVFNISFPINLRCFSRWVWSTFSVSSLSARLAANSCLISRIFAAFSSGVRGLTIQVLSSKSLWPVLLACNSRFAIFDKIFPHSLHL